MLRPRNQGFQHWASTWACSTSSFFSCLSQFHRYLHRHSHGCIGSGPSCYTRWEQLGACLASHPRVPQHLNSPHGYYNFLPGFYSVWQLCTVPCDSHKCCMACSITHAAHSCQYQSLSETRTHQCATVWNRSSIIKWWLVAVPDSLPWDHPWTHCT